MKGQNNAPVRGTLERIMGAGYRQLMPNGLSALSPTAVAEAAQLAPDDVSRHFANAEALLTALILDAYNAMGDSAEHAQEKAAGKQLSLLDQWVAVCRGVRVWAQANPEKYTLIWGPPLPGYSAPPETMIAGARAALVLIGLLRQAARMGTLAEHPGSPPLSPGMQRNVEALVEGMLAGLPLPVVARMLIAWTQFLGQLSFAVYGHVQGFAADPDAFFDHATSAMGEFVGLPKGE